MDFTRVELEEVKRCLNCMISERIKYNLIENSEVRLQDNQKYLQLDYDLLERVIQKLKRG